LVSKLFVYILNPVSWKKKKKGFKFMELGNCLVLHLWKEDPF